MYDGDHEKLLSICYLARYILKIKYIPGTALDLCWL